ncbi:MAG: 1-acyl-sn-glycerol-3-phosphate acyltransferase [Pseudomonadales bacterium]|nr:1-acyl-sn-glycerol-3-phosphate acyltransferase [Pseudomonadales bacterium]
MTLRGHLAATLSLTAIAGNLLVFSVPLVLLVVARSLVPAVRPLASRLGSRIYRLAVAFDDWCLHRISGARWQDPGLDLDPDEVCIVVANHRSWADIFLLQSVIARRGPIVKFLCKRELAYLPVLGLIFVAFDFPILRRRSRGLESDADRRADDRRRVRAACAVLSRSPAAMLSFVEGTRFTEQRRQRVRSPYRRLMPTRPGGFSTLLQALGSLGPAIVDVTIIYPRDVSFWEFLGGAGGEIRILAERFPIHTVAQRGGPAWLDARWRRKDDALVAAIHD